MDDWVSDHMGGILVVVVVSLVIIIFLGGFASAKQKNQFMEQCLKDHKDYECTAMWRAGESHEQVVPVIIPMGR